MKTSSHSKYDNTIIQKEEREKNVSILKYNLPVLPLLDKLKCEVLKVTQSWHILPEHQASEINSETIFRVLWKKCYPIDIAPSSWTRYLALAIEDQGSYL